MFTLHNGDCLQVLPSIPSGSIDAIITDLPYGTTACKWDTVIEFAPMWKEVKRVLKPTGTFITTASQPFTSALIMSNPSMFKYEWIWNKKISANYLAAKKMPLLIHENIVVFSGGGANNGSKHPMTYNPIMVSRKNPRVGIVNSKPESQQNPKYHHLRGREKKEVIWNERYPVSIIEETNAVRIGKTHATQKPVALYEYLIKTYTNEGETVLDIAIGSGTTIEAAERTGRNSIGIEKDEGIFQSAVLRLKSFTPSNNRLHLDVGDSPAQQALFTPEADTAEGKLSAPAPRR